MIFSQSAVNARLDPGLTSKPHVLVVDDDQRIRVLVSRYLLAEGFIVLAAADAREAEALLHAFSFDLMVLDVMMPGETGLDFLKRIRKDKPLPVLMLTALGETEERIEGLHSGADDYLPKPFEPRELILRLHAILRRSRKNIEDRFARVGGWQFDPENESIFNANETRKLTTVEVKLLGVFLQESGRVFSRSELAEACGLSGSERAVDVQITRLRKKIEDNPKMPRYLKTVRGRGYLLREAT